MMEEKEFIHRLHNISAQIRELEERERRLAV